MTKSEILTAVEEMARESTDIDVALRLAEMAFLIQSDLDRHNKPLKPGGFAERRNRRAMQSH